MFFGLYTSIGELLFIPIGNYKISLPTPFASEVASIVETLPEWKAAIA